MRNATDGLKTREDFNSNRSQTHVVSVVESLGGGASVTVPSHHDDVRTVRPDLAVLLGVLRSTPPAHDKA
eukprot:COSAG06_NODE_33953_length_482_cov_0.600522_1_plen_69_part_10